MSKILVIGDTGVGKTTLIKKLILPTNVTMSLVSTTCISFKGNFLSHEVEFVDIKGELVYTLDGLRDFINKLNVDIVIFVYDPSNWKSIENLEDYWIIFCKNNITNDPHIIFCETKTDLGLSETANIKFDGIFDEFKHVKVSSKTGDGIDKLRVAISSDIENMKSDSEKLMSSVNYFSGELCRLLNQKDSLYKCWYNRCQEYMEKYENLKKEFDEFKEKLRDVIDK